MFLKHYPEAVVLPPKIYFYEPKIYGFKVYKKRGSKYFEPAQGTVKYVEDSLTGVEKEKLLKQGKQAITSARVDEKENVTNQVPPVQQPKKKDTNPKAQKKKAEVSQPPQLPIYKEAKAEDPQKENEDEDQAATIVNEGKKKNKKKKNKKNKVAQ